MYDLLDNTARTKTLFMLTATPINNRLSDFRHMAELFTRGDESYFARTLGVNNLRAHFNQMERVLRDRVGRDVTDLAEQMSEAQEILTYRCDLSSACGAAQPRLCPGEPDPRDQAKPAAFPERKAIRRWQPTRSARRMAACLICSRRRSPRDNPLFTLPMYYPLHWYKGSGQGD